MTDFKFQLWLSTDGKHTVYVEADTQEGRIEAMNYAKEVFEKVKERYGTKQEQTAKAYNNKQTLDQATKEVVQARDDICKVHNRFMEWSAYPSKKTGKKYLFHDMEIDGEKKRCFGKGVQV